MYKDKRIYGFIAAKGHSRRLPKKNMCMLKGKPLLSYAINACKASKYIDKVYVSTEDGDISDIAKKNKVYVIKRPKELTLEGVTTQDVMRHFANIVEDFSVLVVVQANSPQVKVENINKAIEYLVDNSLREVRSIDAKGFENGAFWVLKREIIFWKGLSVHFAVIEDNAVDIHYKEDLEKVKESMKYDN